MHVEVNTSKTGTTYLFLWFDPLHGDSDGFHRTCVAERIGWTDRQLVSYKGNLGRMVC